MRVQELPQLKNSQETITIRPEYNVQDASQILSRHKIGALPVVERGGGLVGIVTERDMVRVIAEQGANGLTLPINTIMTSGVISCRKDDNVFDVVEIMSSKKIRHIPVVEGNELLAMLSLRDFEGASKMMRETSITDQLTGLHNQAHFSTLLENEFNRYRWFEAPISIALVQIDNFERLHAPKGGIISDEVLKALADVLRYQTRAYDTIGRIGKDRFAIVFPNTKLNTANRACERILKSVASAEFTKSGWSPVTVSLAVESGTRHCRDGKTIMDRANELLKIAIKNGGDCIESASQVEEEPLVAVNSQS